MSNNVIDYIMLSESDFVRTRYKQLVLPHEDQPQDERDWKKMLRADQQRQYREYVEQFEPKEETSLHNNIPALHKPRNEKWNDYMAGYRKRKVECPKCGHQFKPSKRIK